MKAVLFGIGLVVVEAALAFRVFPWLARVLQSGSAAGQPMARDIAKGLLERLVVFVGLVNAFPTVLTFFGAIKLGTRLPRDAQKRVSNDYFFAGTMISALAAIIYAAVWRWLWP